VWRCTLELDRLDAPGLAALLEALCSIDAAYLRRVPSTPALYAADVRYLAEPDRVELWRAIPVVLAYRAGDCEDLVAWRCAELRVAGELATPVAERFDTRAGPVFHVRVRRGDGAIEDPSRVLGM